MRYIYRYRWGGGVEREIALERFIKRDRAQHRFIKGVERKRFIERIEL